MSIFKRLLCVLLPLLLLLVVLSPAIVAKASDEIIYIDSGKYEVTVKQGIETNTYNTSGSAGWEWRWLPAYRMEGTSYNVDFSFTVDGFSDLEKSYIANADSVKVDFAFGSGGFGQGYIGVMYMGEHYGDLSTAYSYIRFNFEDQSTATVEFDYLYGLTGFSLHQSNATALFNGGFDGRSIQDLELGFKVIMYPNGTDAQPAMISQNIGAVITCSYSDGSDKVIVVNKEILGELGEIGGKLDGVQDSVNQGFDNVIQKQDTIIDKITSGFANIGNQVKKAVTDAVTELFVPSEEDMVAQYDKWDTLMADRFGAVYESSQIIDSFVDSIQVSDTQETIEFPVVSLDIVGTTFEFGGWEVDIIPDGFQWLVDILKLITNIGCTVLFVNGMRTRYESVVK